MLKLFIFLFKNLGASLRGGRHRSGGSVEYLTIPPQSRVFIQMPGDVVYTGILEPPHRGPTPTPENLSINHVLLRGYYENILTTSVFFSANHQNNYIREYSCFIKTRNDTIFKTHLEPYNVEHLQSVLNRVFVRLPIHGYPVYTGALQINNDFEPNWLHFTH